MPNVIYTAVSFLETELGAMKNAMIKKKIDIAFLWSICPETYSFRLHEALGANCSVLTNVVSGNIAAQIWYNGRGIVCWDEPEVLHLLNDSGRVKNLLQSHFSRHTPIDLLFNSQLTEESKLHMMPLNHLDASAASYSWIKPSCKDLLRSIGMETLRTDYIQKMIEHIQDLERMLGIANEHLEKNEQQSREKNALIYSESRAHRLLDNIIRILDRHPATGRAVRSVCSFIWNGSSKIKVRA